MTGPDDVTITIADVASTEPLVVSPASADTLAHPYHAAGVNTETVFTIMSDLGVLSRADRDPLAPRGKTRGRKYRGNGDMGSRDSPGHRGSTRIYRTVRAEDKKSIGVCWGKFRKV